MIPTMKKLLFPLAILLSLSFVMLTTGSIYAQTDLKVTFENGMKNFDKDPVAEIQSMADNLRFVGGDNGLTRNKAQTAALAAQLKSGKHQTQITDLNIRQSGTLGVATGIRNQTLSLSNGVVMTWKDAFTYIFEWKNNNWVMTDLHHTKIDYQLGDDAAIRQVIDAETKAYHEANLAVWTSNWATTPYIERQDEKLRKLANTPYLKGQALQKGYEEFAKTHKPTGLSSTVSDYESHIKGNLAWVTFTQEDKKADGSVSLKQRSLRILEKINGQWKIVMISLTSF
jgi:ketosteroid isomerase-like protein